LLRHEAVGLNFIDVYHRTLVTALVKLRLVIALHMLPFPPEPMPKYD
jgi:hypothetical protein